MYTGVQNCEQSLGQQLGLNLLRLLELSLFGCSKESLMRWPERHEARQMWLTLTRSQSRYLAIF